MIQLMAVQYQVLLPFVMVTACEVVLFTECNMDDTVITFMIDTFICRLNKMAHIFLKLSMTANSNVAICCLIAAKAEPISDIWGVNIENFNI